MYKRQGRDTDVGIGRVVAVGPGGAGARHGNAGILRQFHDAVRRADGPLEAHEVAAARIGPRGDIGFGLSLIHI